MERREVECGGGKGVKEGREVAASRYFIFKGCGKLRNKLADELLAFYSFLGALEGKTI